MPTQQEKAALAAQAILPPPPPDGNVAEFSESKSFGLKTFLKHESTGEVREEGYATIGVGVQVWAQGESRYSTTIFTDVIMLLISKVDLEQWRTANERLVVGACAIKMKR